MSMWDDEAGYDRTDPKHPSWRDGMATAADMRRKAAKENPVDAITERTNAALKAIGEARAAVDELEKALKDAWPW